MYQLDKPDNLVEMLEESVARFGEREWFGAKDAGGEYRWHTYRQVGDRIDNLRGGFARLGIGKGDTIGIISNNSIEWAVACYATYGLAARYVTMYEAELVATWEYIIRDSNTKLLLVSKREIYEKVKHLLRDGGDLKHIVVIEGEGMDSMTELEKTGSMHTFPAVRPGAQDIAGLIYTSGTTGDPKGVLLSHGNITSNIHAILKHFHMLDERTRTLSFLPWAHSYGQVCELHTVMRIGGSCGLAESPATIVNDLAKVRPSLLVSVPRVFYRVYDAIHARMNEQGGLPLALFRMGVNSGKKRRELARAGKSSVATNLKFRIADRLVFSKIRDKFGGRLTIALTGSAAINPAIAEFFNDAGVPLYEALGMTEASPGISTNTPDYNRIGSCGKAFDKVRLVIDTSVTDGDGREGELIVYGPNVMQGYHNKPQATREVMTDDGGLRTGDMAFIDDDGFLYITGRIKESFKLENGKYVFSASMEAEIVLSRYIEYAMICGLNRPHTMCLVLPDFEALKGFAAARNLAADPALLAQSAEVKTLLINEIRTQLEKRFGSYEIPRDILVLNEGFSVENGLLTQSFKLKRKKVLEKYAADIEGLYAR
ncbi:MAG: long-chain fatty acid--CoA ligase [Spirochaetes bacterium]|nr:MAG: long-chain fatty acid--CoA ligase [Spirochaetota bacterium]